MWNLKNETSEYNNNNNKRLTVIENRVRLLRTERCELVYMKGATRAYYTAQGIEPMFYNKYKWIIIF